VRKCDAHWVTSARENAYRASSFSQRRGAFDPNAQLEIEGNAENLASTPFDRVSSRRVNAFVS
jgi:hypothetical protein